MLRVGSFTKHHTLVSQVTFYACLSFYMRESVCVLKVTECAVMAHTDSSTHALARVQTHTRARAHTHTRTHTHTHSHARMHTHSQTRTDTHTNTSMHTNKHTHTYKHTHTHKHTHTYIHTHIHKHIYTHSNFLRCTRTHTRKHIRTRTCTRTRTHTLTHTLSLYLCLSLSFSITHTHTRLSLSLSLSLSHTHTHTEIMRETRLLTHLDHPNIVIFLARSRTHTPCFICLRKSCVSFAEYRLFYRALLQKRLIILWSLLVRETRRDGILQKRRMITHAPCFICLRMFRGKDGRD